MNIFIEEYRGWTISFDKDGDTFVCDCYEKDKQSKRSSYSAAKKGIDEYSKANLNFVPFEIQGNPNMSSYWAGKILIVTGIRKDGSFTVKDENGNSARLSDWDYKHNYFGLVNPDNARILTELEEIKQRQNTLYNLQKETEKQFVPGASIEEHIKQFLL